jgi:hypothetical protein
MIRPTAKSSIDMFSALLMLVLASLTDLCCISNGFNHHFLWEELDTRKRLHTICNIIL